MIITNCVWEKDNIGKRTCEIIIERDDHFSSNAIDEAISNYEYVVVKVPVNMYAFNDSLSKEGFIFIENQLHVTKRKKDFQYSDRILEAVSREISFHTIKDKSDLEELIDRITPNMFSTDRVYIDDCLGPDFSLRRYRNWTRTAFERGSLLYEYSLNGLPAGFGLLNMDSQKHQFHYLLGGVYEQYQNCGYGILTPASPFLYSKEHGIDVDMIDTHISSNNLPVIRLYNYLGYSISDMYYVFVMHC